MIAWFIAVLILTPWFWSWNAPLPRDFFDTKLARDVRESKTIINTERSQTADTSFNFLFSNWQKEFLSLRFEVLMENLDIGNYFFAGHPRERVGVREKQKFFFFQFILFLVGLTTSGLKKYRRFLIIYVASTAVAVLIFSWRTFEETLPLAVPFVLVMALGSKQIFSFPKKWIFLFCCLVILEIVAFSIFKTKGLMQ